LPLLSVPVPNVVVPSLNVTVPVAADGDTVAVKVTDELYVDGLDEDESVVVVFVFAKARLVIAKEIIRTEIPRQRFTSPPRLHL